MAAVLPDVISKNKIPFLLAVTFLIVLVVLGFLFWNSNKQKEEEEQKGPSIAVVNGEKIYKKDYDGRLSDQNYFYTKISKLPEPQKIEDLDEIVLEDMIQEKLLTQILAKQNIKVTEEEVKTKIKQNAVDRSFNGDWKAYEEELKTRYQTTLEQVIFTYRLTILKEKIAQLKDRKHIYAIWIEKIEPQFVSYENLQADVRAALERVNKPKKDKAEQAANKIRNGEDFGKVASEYSEDQESKLNKGDLGFLYLPTSVNEPSQKTLDSFPGKAGILEALKENLKVGEVKIYDVFPGYVVIKVSEIQQGVIGNKSFDDWYSQYRKEAKVTVNR